MTDELSNEDEVEDVDDEDSSLGDDVLDEVAGEDESDDEDDTEGFGHIDDKVVKEVPESDDDEEEEDDFVHGLSLLRRGKKQLCVLVQK